MPPPSPPWAHQPSPAPPTSSPTLWPPPSPKATSRRGPQKTTLSPPANRHADLRQRLSALIRISRYVPPSLTFSLQPTNKNPSARSAPPPTHQVPSHSSRTYEE